MTYHTFTHVHEGIDFKCTASIRADGTVCRIDITMPLAHFPELDDRWTIQEDIEERARIMANEMWYAGELKMDETIFEPHIANY